MNEQLIMEKIKETLDERKGDEIGGSGHLSHVSIGNVKIEKTEEVTQQGERHLRVQYSYTVDRVSEFTYADETDSDEEPQLFDPYHYRETGEIIIPL